MGPAKWRIPHVRFLRGAPHGTAPHFDAKGDQRMIYNKKFRTWRKRSALDIVYYRLWSARQNGVRDGEKLSNGFMGLLKVRMA
jgi:hypothetical protein